MAKSGLFLKHVLSADLYVDRGRGGRRSCNINASAPILVHSVSPES